MMEIIMPQPGSPNSNWQIIGAEIERKGFHRTIRLRGHIVCINAGYESELSISRWLLNPQY